MQRQVIQRPGWGPGGCSFCGLYFNERFVKAVDCGFVMCFCYMVFTEIMDYKKYKEIGACSKPFDVFWVGHFTSIAFFRLFYYLEKFFYYRLALVFFERDTTRLRSARFWAVTMMCCRLWAFCGFVVFTIIGSVWFVEDGKCLNKLDENSTSNSEVTMAIWLMICFSVCLIYALKTLLRQVLTPRQLVQGDDNEHFNMFTWADQFRGPRDRSLTVRELNAIKKSELCSYDELKRPSRQAIEMSTLTTNQQKPLSEDSLVPQESVLTQDEDEPSENICAVCLDDIAIGQWYKRLPKCEHCFHAKCIDQWLSTRATCPVCREEIFPDVEQSVANGINPRSVRREIRIGAGHSDREPRVVLRFTR